LASLLPFAHALQTKAITYRPAVFEEDFNLVWGCSSHRQGFSPLFVDADTISRLDQARHLLNTCDTQLRPRMTKGFDLACTFPWPMMEHVVNGHGDAE
jgi:hypothetical protein